LKQQALDHVLAGGDDYELAFTAPASARDALHRIGEQTGLRLSRIGCIEAEPGLRLRDAQGQALDVAARSFDHFRPAS
jgi:thiamine-monophosphate kinase